MKISNVKNPYWAVFHAMDIFSSGFIAPISYLENKIVKMLKKIPLRGILGYFGDFFGFWDIFKILFFYFL
jgi:hypothetical protein